MPNRRISRPRPAAPLPDAGRIAVMAGDREVHVAVRRSARARRYVLRIAATGDGAVVTIPDGGTIAGARDFVGRQAGWLAERLADPLGGQPVDTVPLRGVLHRVRRSGAPRGGVSATMTDDGPTLVVGGEDAHLRRRLSDYLKREARADLAAAVGRHAAALGVRPTALRLKDTVSRWGSASASGALAFSWRLVMAPPFVLDYVAAHEVAHLVEMNHSPRFWAICRRLAPRTEEARAWLTRSGRDLHRAL